MKKNWPETGSANSLPSQLHFLDYEVAAHNEVLMEVAAPDMSTLRPGLIWTTEKVNLISRTPVEWACD